MDTERNLAEWSSRHSPQTQENLLDPPLENLKHHYSLPYTYVALLLDRYLQCVNLSTVTHKRVNHRYTFPTIRYQSHCFHVDKSVNPPSGPALHTSKVSTCLQWHSSRGSNLVLGFFFWCKYPVSAFCFTSYKFSEFYFSKFELSTFMQEVCANIIWS